MRCRPPVSIMGPDLYPGKLVVSCSSYGALLQIIKGIKGILTFFVSALSWDVFHSLPVSKDSNALLWWCSLHVLIKDATPHIEDT